MVVASLELGSYSRRGQCECVSSMIEIFQSLYRRVHYDKVVGEDEDAVEDQYGGALRLCS